VEVAAVALMCRLAPLVVVAVVVPVVAPVIPVARGALTAVVLDLVTVVAQGVVPVMVRKVVEQVAVVVVPTAQASHRPVMVLVVRAVLPGPALFLVVIMRAVAVVAPTARVPVAVVGPAMVLPMPEPPMPRQIPVVVGVVHATPVVVLAGQAG
jgi:hypothetical protein